MISLVLCPAASVWAQDEIPDKSFTTGNNVAADNNRPSKPKRKKSALYRFFQKFNYTDSTYIEPNHYNFTAMLQESTLFNFYAIEGRNDQDQYQRINLKTKTRMKIGPYLGWHWAFFGYQFDIGHSYPSSKTQQYNISIYSSTFGIDYIHNRNNGDFTITRTKGFGKTNDSKVRNVDFDGLKTYNNSLNVYYIFNHKRFSYPAAFSQSTQQKKSCGSWKIGFLYSHQKLSFDYTKLPAALLSEEDGGTGIFDEMKFNDINYYDYSVNFGYAYNWVFARNWLFAISALPALGYKFSKGQNIDHREIFSAHNINFDVVGRLGLVWNTNRFFAGLSSVVHAYNYRKTHFRVSNTIMMTNIYFGINFCPKGHYRRTNPQKYGRW